MQSNINSGIKPFDFKGFVPFLFLRYKNSIYFVLYFVLLLFVV